MVVLEANIKKFFFDKAVVQDAMSRKTYNALWRIGSWVRIVARRSMRDRNGSSPAGKPPHAHGRRLLKEKLWFAFDGSNRMNPRVVVGPVKLRTPPSKMLINGHRWTITKGGKLKQKRVEGGFWMKYTSPVPGPQLQEQGGTVTLEDGSNVKVAAHPYMRPAMEKRLSKMSKAWSGSFISREAA